MKNPLRFYLLFFLLIPISCSHKDIKTPSGEAYAKVYSRDNAYLGTVNFVNDKGEVKITGEFKGLTPNSKLGFHIHEKGKCESNFESSGGHFNPTKLPHGSPGVASHVGDLGNIITDKNGNAHYEYTSEQINLYESANSVIDKAIIIHSGTDDMYSQPSGDAGQRIGCGIIHELD